MAWLVIAANLLCAQLARGQGPEQVLEQAWIEPHVGAQVPAAARFRDHVGAPVTLADLQGERPTVLCLVYFECPMLCKLAADGLVRGVASIGQRVGDDFNVAFVSFDPRDNPARSLAARTEALRRYGIDSDCRGWYFLTGDRAAIDQLTRSVGFHYAWDEATQQFSHASGVILLAPDGTITQYLDGVHFAPRELSTAIAHAASSQLTHRQNISFVRCYLYDPTTGKFGAAVQWTLRGLGVATVLALGVMFVRLSSKPGRSTRKQPL
jgi:protein SCO1/2